MLSTLNAQPTLWEAILPEMCLGMPAELEAVDRLLDDSAFFEQQGPCRHHGGSRQRCLPDGLGPDGQGRGQDGQEHREAQGCGTGLEDQVAGPDSHDAGPGPVHWCQLSRRSGEAKDEVMAINADMVRIARVAVAEARHVAANARRALKRLGDAAPRRLCSIAGDLEITAGRSHGSPNRPRSVSVAKFPTGRPGWCHCMTPMPVLSARVGKPVEFGYKAQVVDNEDGVVLDHTVEVGHPPDAPMLITAVERVARRARRMPRRSLLIAATRSENSSAGSECAQSSFRQKADQVRHGALSRAERSSSGW